MWRKIGGESQLERNLVENPSWREIWWRIPIGEKSGGESQLERKHEIMDSQLERNHGFSTSFMPHNPPIFGTKAVLELFFPALWMRLMVGFSFNLLIPDGDLWS